MDDVEWVNLVNRTSLHWLRVYREKMLWLMGQMTTWGYGDPERLETYQRQVAACEKRIAELEAKPRQDSDEKPN